MKDRKNCRYKYVKMKMICSSPPCHKYVYFMDIVMDAHLRWQWLILFRFQFVFVSSLSRFSTWVKSSSRTLSSMAFIFMIGIYIEKTQTKAKNPQKNQRQQIFRNKYCWIVGLFRKKKISFLWGGSSSLIWLLKDWDYIRN